MELGTKRYKNLCEKLKHKNNLNSDICDLIPTFNFLLVKDFYENEFINSQKNQKTQKHNESLTKYWKTNNKYNADLKKFSTWLKKAYKFITIEKPKLQKQISNSLPKEPKASQNKNWIEKIVSKNPNDIENSFYRVRTCQEIYGKTYHQVYGKSLRLEKKLKNLETQFLKEIIEYRHFFWT